MPKTVSINADSVNERSSLISDLASIKRQNSLHRRSSAALNEANKKLRFRAIRICYFGMFVSSIVFSITISSLWPFLQVIDKAAETTFLGWLVAAFSLGQLITSPIIGYIANRTNNNKMPLVISTALIVISNILYAYMQSISAISNSTKWWLLFSRFIMGIGAANSTIMRSYASSATTMTERTPVMANLSAYQGIGFILGPLIQAVLAFLGYPGPVHRSWLYLNIYTAPAFFSAITAAVNFVLFLIVFDDIRAVIVPPKIIDGSELDSKVSSDVQRNQFWAILCCLYIFFVAYLTFTNYETIASPLSIDMYAWSNEKSTEYNGYILGTLGCMSVVVLIVTKILAKRYQDRVLMLGGMFICFLGYFVFLPWGSTYPSTAIATYTGTAPTVTAQQNTTTMTAETTTTNGGGIGCPLDYPWCQYVPVVRLWQYITASVVITIGFSVCNVICYSTFSKKLGERPQGTMMGIFSSAGSLARAFGPISVGFLYKQWGPRVMMIFMLIFVLSAIVVLFYNYKRLYIEPDIPDDFSDAEEEEENKSDGNSQVPV